MNPIRRELLNGLIVLVVASLLSVAFAEFQLKFDAQLWVLILMAIAIATTGYVVFEFALKSIASTEEREKEWLKRVGTPARFELNLGEEAAGLAAVAEAVKAIRPGSDYTVMYYFGAGGGESFFLRNLDAREKNFNTPLEQLKRGIIREYKRIICFDHDTLANDHDLRSGVLRVGEGPETVDRSTAEHCRRMMETKGCSLYVAPAVLRSIVILYGADKVSMTVEATEANTGGRVTAGLMFFSDPPNGEIIEQFRQMERDTERRMVAVHKIIFPEDATTTAQIASR